MSLSSVCTIPLDEVAKLGLIQRSSLLKANAILGSVRAILNMHPPALGLLLGTLLTASRAFTLDQNESLNEVRSLIAANDYDSALDTLETFLATEPSHPQG